jgi:tetratricopeptide (TPR) repeat protein
VPAVLTREQLPQAWAATQNNLGVALGDLAQRSEGPQATAYLEQAVGAYRGALEVSTESDSPLQWTRTMRNLALIYEQKKDWAHARETYAKLLHHYPNDPQFRAKVEALTNQR